ncbi:CotG/ExsB N-terminal domain-containing protein [Mesobacillus maritimus]|uniref:Uncharacterized protein n=1 Tax=Mesobacillus maritimus TaxID=1643336 RepID=A0ABS7K028_9BACI|nr:hypothetical protein [Mesobacillus maritimus]MBY0095601.1 hypothetical protein [Mesobacillus maritimus]
MTRSYSSHDIEKAVEIAETRGLDDFLMQHPHEKRIDTDKKTEREFHRNFTGQQERNENTKKSIFDVIMFGSSHPKTHHKDSHADQIMTSSSSERSESPRIEDDMTTCDPCEEVQEIVRGIRAGKYKLRTTALQGGSTTERTHHNKNNRLRHPEHWRTLNNHKRETRMNEVQQDQLHYHSAYWENGNMWALKLKLK